MINLLAFNGLHFSHLPHSCNLTHYFSLANQLKVSPILFEQSYLETRASGRFRLKIREFLGYKLATLSDAEILIAWLMDEAKNGPYTMPQYREKAYQFFRSHKLEPFTPERIDRYIKSGKYRFEKKFFSNISKQLSPKAVKLLISLSWG